MLIVWCKVRKYDKYFVPLHLLFKQVDNPRGRCVLRSGINTSQGEDRYVVSFRDKQTGDWGKFFTASEEMKNILDQISDIEDGFPFETTIVSEVFDGGKVKYKFS